MTPYGPDGFHFGLGLDIVCIFPSDSARAFRVLPVHWNSAQVAWVPCHEDMGETNKCGSKYTQTHPLGS